MKYGRILKNFFGLTSRFRSTTQKMSLTYVWIDLEMTGINPEKDSILEIACVLTNPELQPLHEGISYVIYQPEDILASMNSWCIKQHQESGLTEACRKSQISLSEAETKVVDYIKQYAVGHKHLAGNSVYMDKLFLAKYMPNINNLLHYQILDVSSIRLVCNEWYPEELSKLPKKKSNHRAFDDILESIQELKTYREYFFKTK